jgi:hypothetical protein
MSANSIGQNRVASQNRTDIQRPAPCLIGPDSLLADKPASYYTTASLQMSKGSVADFKVDAKAKDAIVDALSGQGDGRISMADVDNIMAKIEDGGRIGKGEWPLIALLHAACDDRKDVRIDGKKVRITDAAEGMLLPDSHKAYYAKADIQIGASAPPKTHTVDADLAFEIQLAGWGQGDGRISLADMQNILDKITDGAAYGEGEKPLARMLLQACDDRQHVFLNGQRVRITDGGEDLLKTTLPKFWGSLGGRPAGNQGAEIDQDTQNAIGLDPQNIPAPSQGPAGSNPNSLFNLRIQQDSE